MKKRYEMLRPYLEAIPDILKYQLTTKALLIVILFLLGRVFRILLNSAGRVAVTSSDFLFLFVSWQGLLILLICLFTLFIYVAIELFTKIILSENHLTGKKLSLPAACRKALVIIRKLFNIKGIGVILYIVLIAPIVGIGFSITLTSGFYIPTFITSVIVSTPLYLILMIIAILIFAFIGIVNIFLLHGMVIDQLSVEEATLNSRRLMKANWKDYLKENILFILVMSSVLALVALIVLILPLLLTNILPLPANLKRGLTVFFFLHGTILSTLASLMATPMYTIKMTELYHSYSGDKNYSYKGHAHEIPTLDKIKVIAAIGLTVTLSIILTAYFDTIFPVSSDVRIIAHRAGGSEATENTLGGLESSIQKGVFGAEIDIQRSKDGYYIINHDSNFKRVANDSREPEEMTLAEIKKLSIDGEPVPTLTEMLQASKGKLILFIELKGKSADQQMADDAVKIIRDLKMEDETVLISLDYDLIDYIESNYPQMHTGFLTFAAFGDTALLNCDYLALEEESATYDTINAVHKQGKSVMIWTANRKGSQKHFLCSKADAIITDNITQALTIQQQLQYRNDLERMIDKVKEIIS